MKLILNQCPRAMSIASVNGCRECGSVVEPPPEGTDTVFSDVQHIEKVQRLRVCIGFTSLLLRLG